MGLTLTDENEQDAVDEGGLLVLPEDLPGALRGKRGRREAAGVPTGDGLAPGARFKRRNIGSGSFLKTGLKLSIDYVTCLKCQFSNSFLLQGVSKQVKSQAKIVAFEFGPQTADVSWHALRGLEDGFMNAIADLVS